MTTTYRGDAGTLELTLAAAESTLNGNGPAPVQLLDQDRAAIFTHPDITRNRLFLSSLRGDRALGAAARLRGVVFYRRNRTLTVNGDQAEWARCTDPALTTFLCGVEDDGTEAVITDAAGQNVPFDDVHPYDASDNSTRTTQNAFGGAAEVAVDRPLGPRENHLANRFFLGASGDEGRAHFTSQSALARLSASRGTLPTDIVVPSSLVQVDSVTRKLGFYASDTLTLLPGLFLTASARFNTATLSLEDRLGDELSGDHFFWRVNPAGGVSYQPRPWFGAFAGYGESTRAPTALELTCASPDDPCRLPNSFLSDPPLAQVVARTFETGVRGRLATAASTLGYAVAAFRTTNSDDIIFIGTGPVVNLGYFDNVGQTRRQGVEASLTGRRALPGRAGRLEWALHYTWLDATFQTAFSAPSPNHPDADAATGRIDVPVGARLPGVPRHLGKATLGWVFANRLSVAVHAIANGNQVRRSDEANLLAPVAGFVIADLRASWDVSPAVSVFGRLSNLFDARYSTFGTLGAPSAVLGPTYTDPRFDGPGAPRAAWAGLALRY
jgi:outer membrane receptor protein involved in Fe transport